VQHNVSHPIAMAGGGSMEEGDGEMISLTPTERGGQTADKQAPT
jgi:hypothetical protein